MIDSLFNLIKENCDELITQNPVLGGLKTDEVFHTTAETILLNLQSKFGTNGAATIYSLFYNGASEDTYTANLIPEVTNALTIKNKLTPDKAASIANIIVPVIVPKLLRKTNDPKDGSFSLDKIINTLSTSQQGI